MHQVVRVLVVDDRDPSASQDAMELGQSLADRLLGEACEDVAAEDRITGIRLDG